MQRQFELIESPGGALTLRRPGESDEPNVRLRRAFPWSHARSFISVRASGGVELLLIESLEDLDDPQRQLIERWLDQHSFVPKITRIDHVDATLGRQQWRVQTDRGAAHFTVQEREDIRFLPDGRFAIRDADGNMYELNQLNELDVQSRRAVESLL